MKKAERVISRHANSPDAQPSSLHGRDGHGDVALNPRVQRESGFDIGTSQTQTRPRARGRSETKTQRQRRARVAFVRARSEQCEPVHCAKTDEEARATG